MKSVTLHSYPFYVPDWVRSETRIKLSTAGRGMYRELLDYCWIEGTLPADEKALLSISGGTKREFESQWPIMAVTFREADGRLHHWKVDAERPKLVVWRESRRENGSAGGRAKAQAVASGIASARTGAKLDPSQALAKPYPSSSSSSSSSSEENPLPPFVDPGSVPDEQTPEEWAKRLHTRHPKLSTLRFTQEFCSDSWHRLGDGEKFSRFMSEVYAGLERWCGYWDVNGVQYAEKLNTWLDAEGWKKTPPTTGKRKTGMELYEDQLLAEEAAKRAH